MLRPLPSMLVAASLLAVSASPAAAQTMEQLLLPSDPDDYAAFGNDVSIDGDVILVGSRDKPVNGLNYAGAGYVFRKVGGLWAEEARLTVPNPEVHDELGYAVDLSGDVAILGAPDFPVSAFSGTGRAWIFRRDANGVWNVEQELVPTIAFWDSATGREVAVGGDVALVVRPMSFSTPGAVAVYEYLNGTWTQTSTLQAPVQFGGFGAQAEVAADGNGFAVSDATHVYVYERSGASWVLAATLVPPQNVDANGFGYHLGFDGNRAVVGAPNAQVDGWANAGRAFSYARTPSGWILEQVIENPQLGTLFGFGSSPSLDGDLCATRANDSCVVLRWDGAEWVPEPAFAPATLPSGAQFAISVAVSGNQAVMGASGSFASGMLGDGGAYVYRLDQPFHLRLLNGPLQGGDNFDFDVHGATPATRTWLAFSLTGTGSTFVPRLGATLDLAQPSPIGSVTTDSAGKGIWTVVVPPNVAPGTMAWFQAIEPGAATVNVLAEVTQ